MSLKIFEVLFKMSESVNILIGAKPSLRRGRKEESFMACLDLTWICSAIVRKTLRGLEGERVDYSKVNCSKAVWKLTVQKLTVQKLFQSWLFQSWLFNNWLLKSWLCKNWLFKSCFKVDYLKIDFKKDDCSKTNCLKVICSKVNFFRSFDLWAIHPACLEAVRYRGKRPNLN